MLKITWKDQDGKIITTTRTKDESVYGYILMDDYKLLYDKPDKVKALHKIFPYSTPPNWIFKKGVKYSGDDDLIGTGGTEYVGFEELTSLSKDQETYAKNNNITFVGDSKRFQEWLQANTVFKMVVLKIKQGYRAVKSWVLE